LWLGTSPLLPSKKYREIGEPTSLSFEQELRSEEERGQENGEE